MEKILLALIINHPALFDEFGESFVQLEIQTPEFAPLRQRVVDHLTQDHDAAPTPAELRRSLSDPEESPFAYESGGTALDEILSPDIYMHAKAARPEASTDEARKAWLSIWATLEQGKIRADYAVACALYREQPSEENKERMETLQNKVLLFASEGADNQDCA
jgi:DNA primase